MLRYTLQYKPEAIARLQLAEMLVDAHTRLRPTEEDNDDSEGPSLCVGD